ncbi:hypothetical protein [Tsukamurella strandjordii]|uniref:Uncharacterized protein n=1 Tax=Tsukamurella strandjordii TaxID=147577 RepID=A0AA90NBP8_9ACTN|nr:hypothetical protein [Tsukamurella strandjordii]MDP0398770.1 hypothetical protein [Tsukamurella strandjordii]
MNLGALASSAVPIVLGLFVKLVTDGREPAQVRSIRRLSDLRGTLPESLQADLDVLIRDEVAALVTAGRNRLSRQLSGSGIAAVIFVSAVLVGINFGLVMWALSIDSWVRWIMWAVVAVAGLLSIGIVAAGLPSIYDQSALTPDRDNEARGGLAQ